MSRGKARIQDVARAAGVSTATVSRTLSQPQLVSQATRLAVLAAIEATGYTVNQAARNLRRQRTGGIVALVPNLANPFFSRILSGIAAVLAPAGYNLLIVDTRAGADAEARILQYLDRSRADGLIVLDGGLAAAALTAERPGGAVPPAVLACEWIDGLAAPRISVDNAAGARLAVAHLAALGHRAIGHVLGPEGNVLTDARAGGTRAALAAHGLEVEEEWFLPGDFSLESGRAAAERWLGLAARPSAMFFASDEMACGFIGAVHRHGLSVPRDVSVVGFDDIEIATHLTPALTTIRQPRGTIGEAAARAILGLIAGEGPSAAETLLPVDLALRDSTAPAR